MKTNQKTIAKQTLSREEMKKVSGGNVRGSKCGYYCCPTACSTALITEIMPCTSNEQCQEHALSQHNMTCGAGDYVAALCLG